MRCGCCAALETKPNHQSIEIVPTHFMYTRWKLKYMWRPNHAPSSSSSSSWYKFRFPFSSTVHLLVFTFHLCLQNFFFPKNFYCSSLRTRDFGWSVDFAYVWIFFTCVLFLYKPSCLRVCAFVRKIVRVCVCMEKNVTISFNLFHVVFSGQ